MEDKTVIHQLIPAYDDVWFSVETTMRSKVRRPQSF